MKYIYFNKKRVFNGSALFYINNSDKEDWRTK